MHRCDTIYICETHPMDATGEESLEGTVKKGESNAIWVIMCAKYETNVICGICVIYGLHNVCI